ncbi:Persistence and stress-resistance antitoxin PasI [Aquicella siphonis]|uniref:UPF0125 protein AQUSIP_16910 n=1 Tax=Aquicella siphonis TaxID=254247 RepID=A0A5E4PH96_9COXI|nr:RnfH family protein [Aquicella siphonis]VVC76379.1 Persistence and stress-resistance antitoxin PasI [Aquicella siphonis]
MASKTRIRVEVAFAAVDKQAIRIVELDAGTTIESAIRLSGILSDFPEIRFDRHKVGVFSKPRALTDTVQDGDRIEIYRPLLIDPKESRRIKAKKT